MLRSLLLFRAQALHLCLLLAKLGFSRESLTAPVLGVFLENQVLLDAFGAVESGKAPKR